MFGGWYRCTKRNPPDKGEGSGRGDQMLPTALPPRLEWRGETAIGETGLVLANSGLAGLGLLVAGGAGGLTVVVFVTHIWIFDLGLWKIEGRDQPLPPCLSRLAERQGGFEGLFRGGTRAGDDSSNQHSNRRNGGLRGSSRTLGLGGRTASDFIGIVTHMVFCFFGFVFLRGVMSLNTYTLTYFFMLSNDLRKKIKIFWDHRGWRRWYLNPPADVETEVLKVLNSFNLRRMWRRKCLKYLTHSYTMVKYLNQ